ncbi:hypothetical protein 17 [Diadegma semiclausum ichnovirus]|nr:hypothetical protein 17 [Diadegma semiclausum ichnovirus]
MSYQHKIDYEVTCIGTIRIISNSENHALKILMHWECSYINNRVVNTYALTNDFGHDLHDKRYSSKSHDCFMIYSSSAISNYLIEIVMILDDLLTYRHLGQTTILRSIGSVYFV